MTEDRRFNLDEIEARMKNLDREERIRLGLDPDTPRSLVPDDKDELIAYLRAENERMQTMITRALDARTRARDFMAIWSDPRKLPDLIQEVYQSHPNLVTVRQELGDEAAQRAARLIAHLGVTYEIHPLISGMIYAWADKGKVCVEIGYRGYQEMLDRRQGLDIDGPHEMTPEQRTLHGLAPEDRGSICRVWDWAKKTRFEQNGIPYKPYEGIGVWRAQNKFNRSDNVANGRSSQWQSDKNAIKDVARRALSFSIIQTANIPDTLDFSYDSEQDAWVLPVAAADWVNNSLSTGRFARLLAEKDVTEETFNAFLGHNWRYTQLEPDEIKTKLDEYLAVQKAPEAPVTEEPAEEPAAPAAEAAPAATDAKPEVQAEQLAAEASEESAATTEETPAAAPKSELVEFFGPRAETKDETPAKPKKKAKVKVCENCKVEPGAETPIGWYCKTCAQNLADKEAA